MRVERHQLKEWTVVPHPLKERALKFWLTQLTHAQDLRNPLP